MAEACLRRTPIFIHLDKELQEDGLAKECLYLATGLCSHALKGLAAFANDNTLLTVTLHIDDGTNADNSLRV